MKDASAAAVYGAKAANGVIIVSTKKGKNGKPMINFSTNWSFSTMGANRDVYDGEGYLKYRRDWYVAGTYGVNPETGAYEEYQADKKKYPAGYYDAPTQENRINTVLPLTNGVHIPMRVRTFPTKKYGEPLGLVYREIALPIFSWDKLLIGTIILFVQVSTRITT